MGHAKLLKFQCHRLYIENKFKLELYTNTYKHIVNKFKNTKNIILIVKSYIHAKTGTYIQQFE